MATQIFIDGEAGTTGLQIRERLAARGDISLLKIADAERKDLKARKTLLNAADIAILCLPDDAARESVSLIENETTRVIDASTAFRTNPNWVYGFAEMDEEQSDKISNARFVSNPGCWPQGVIATMRPLVLAGLYADVSSFDEPLNVTGISGFSGGGNQMIAAYEAQGAAAPAFSPYGLTFQHKHLPEMQIYGGYRRKPLFVPAVGNYYKGMLETIGVPLSSKVPTAREIHEILSAHFTAIADGFVTVMPFEQVSRSDLLDPQALNGTNEMHLHVFGNDESGQTVVIAVYDNLGKGASGAAVQNLNLMMGADAKAGL